MLEERNENLRKKIALVENNMLDTNKKVMVEVKTSASDLIEIKAMEKVFQQILPSLTENVTELSKITKSMKKK